MAVTNVGSLVGELGIDTSGFNKGLAQAGSRINNSMKNWERQTRVVGDRLGAIGKTMSLRLTAPMLALGAAGFGLALRLGNAATNMLKFRDAFGVSLEFLQGLKGVAAELGVPFEAFERIFQRIVDIATEEDLARIEKILPGISKIFLDSEGELRDVETIFLELIQVLGGIENPLERAAIGTELFSDEWKNVAPLVAAGRKEVEDIIEETDKLPDATVEAAAAMDAAWEKTKVKLGTVLDEMSANLLPFMENQLLPFLEEKLIPFLEDKLIPLVERWIDTFSKLSPVTQSVLVILAALAFILGPLAIVLGFFITAVGGLIGVVRVLGTGLIFLATSPIALVIAAIIALVAFAIFMWLKWSEITDAIREKTGAWADFIIQTFEMLMGSTGILGVILAVVNLKNTWKEEWQEMMDFINQFIQEFQQGMDDLVGIVKTAVSKIVDLINIVISAWNALEFRVPSVTFPKALGGGTFGGFSIGTPDIDLIPTLAHGGIITAPTLAMIGEAGPEAVLPLDALGDLQGGGPTFDLRGANIFDADGLERLMGRMGAQVIRHGGWSTLGRRR